MRRVWAEMLRALKGHDEVDLFKPARMEQDIQKPFVLSRYLVDLQKHMLQEGSTERHGFLPLMLERDDYSHFPDHLSDEEYELERKECDWMAIGMSIYRVPGSDLPSITVYLLNPYLRQTASDWTQLFDLPVERIDGHYVSQVSETAPWLFAMLTDFIASKSWGAHLVTSRELVKVASLNP